MESKHLKLTPDNFPLQTSLREQVLKHCASPEDQVTTEALEIVELLTYLQQIPNPEQAPLDSILAQTEAIGDPALPTAEQSAILRWLESAFTLWQQNYPLEEPIAAQLRQFKPLLATLALTDPMFLQPGAHAAHQLLDTAQVSAIGWQERLGRAGEQLLRHLSAMSETALQNFLQGNTDQTELLAGLKKFAERDRAKLQRLEQRLVATEEGQTKAAQARSQSARMINNGLRKYTATTEIGELLKGPWYASVQLVILKFGPESDQWRQVEQTTEALLQSLNFQENENTGRQHLFEVATQLPKSIKRWLMSLHHDSDALDDAVGIVESAHMELMRNQDLELRKIDIIPETGAPDDGAEHSDGNLLAVAAFDIGQWFLIETPKGSLRALLVLKKIEEQQLLFANQAGIKTLMLDFREFASMLTQAQAIPLESGASFSISLARAAGLASVDNMAATGSAAQQTKPGAQVERQREQEQLEHEEQQREQEQLEHQERQREQQRLEQEERQREQQRLEHEEQQREQQRLEHEEQQREQQRLEHEEQQRKQQRLEQEERQREQQRLEHEEQQREQQRLEHEEQQREQQRLEHEEQQREQQRLEHEEQQREQQRLEHEEQQREQQRLEHEERDRKAAELSLPMGAWLRFRDGDSPMVAKLALQRRQDEVYIFVNRKGIVLREVKREPLLALIANQQIDILDARPSFQEQVDRVRDKLREGGG